MQIRLAGLAALLLLVACGGETGSSTTVTAGDTTTIPVATTVATTTTTTPPGFVVTSEDGDLTVEVPFEAMAADPGITIRLLAPEEFPPELASAADDPDARIYNLEPEGLVFDAPVRVTRRLDAARFEDLTPFEVPTLVILTRSDNGGYEPYSDLRVVRSGGDVFVSGTTTHFSPVIVVRESPTTVFTVTSESIEDIPATRSVVDLLATVSTEAGQSIRLSATHRDREGVALEPPSFFAWDPAAIPTASIEGVEILVGCDQVGGLRSTLDAIVRFDVNTSSGAAGLSAIPRLMPGLTVLGLRVGLDVRFDCLDPVTSILGVRLTGFETTVDHPGGISWIPGEDFRGGLSGLLVSIDDVPRLEGVWGGLICDNNRSGIIDLDDTMFPAYPFAEIFGTTTLPALAEKYAYVAPLFDFANFFVYVVDAPQYSSMPSEGSWTVSAGLVDYRSRYIGSGRFETSIGYVGTGGMPFVVSVGPDEDVQSAPEARVEFFDMFRND